MQVTLEVKRFDPESGSSEQYDQEYTVEVEDYYTVLDALLAVRDYDDPTLALRCS